MVIQATTNSPLRAAFLIQEFHETCLGTGAVVVLTLLVVLGEELESGVPGDTVLGGEILVLLVIGINVGNDALKNS